MNSGTTTASSSTIATTPTMTQNYEQSAAVISLDDMIKEYLVYRGFISSVKSFETEKKQDKVKHFQVCIMIFFVTKFRWPGTKEWKNSGTNISVSTELRIYQICWILEVFGVQIFCQMGPTNSKILFCFATALLISYPTTIQTSTKSDPSIYQFFTSSKPISRCSFATT